MPTVAGITCSFISSSHSLTHRLPIIDKEVLEQEAVPENNGPDRLIWLVPAK